MNSLRGHDTIDFFEKKLNLKFVINVKFEYFTYYLLCGV